MAMKKRWGRRKNAPVPVEHDYRGSERMGKCPQGDCRTPDGISGYWGEEYQEPAEKKEK